MHSRDICKVTCNVYHPPAKKVPTLRPCSASCKCIVNNYKWVFCDEDYDLVTLTYNAKRFMLKDNVSFQSKNVMLCVLWPYIYFMCDNSATHRRSMIWTI